MMMNSHLRLSVPFALAAAGFMLAGCQSSVSATGTVTQPTASASVAGASSAASTTPTVAANTGASAGAASVAGCTATQLKIQYTTNAQILAGSLDGMSHVNNVVTFTNQGSASCEMGGYPGVAALNSTGKQVMQAVRASGAGKLITLAPGAVASALVSGDTASCDKPTTLAGLLVTAPNQRTSTQLSRTIGICLPSLKVGTVVLGDSAGT
jgi:hypothetical protein